MSFRRTIFAVVFLFGAASQAHAECPPFPESEYLGSFTHEQVKNYVNKSAGGDWTPYMVTLQKNLEALQKLQKSDEGAVLNVRGQPVRVDATGINRYIYASRQWLAVAQCLAEDQVLASLNNFTTAAGDTTTKVAETKGIKDNTKVVGLDNQVASLTGKPIKLKISSSCEAGETTFVVTNDASDWPSTGTFSMFRIDGPNRQAISARRMSLTAGETKMFKVTKTQNMTGEVGMAIDPSWYKRTFQIDASAKCQ